MRANHRLASLLLVLGVGGCGEHPVDPVDATLAGAKRQTRTLEARTAIDLLFVIDDSGSMCEEQDSLAHNFRALSDLFFDRLGPAADLRVAVTSTSVEDTGGNGGLLLARPAPPVPSLNCFTPDSEDPFMPDTADCAALVDNGTLPSVLALGPDGNVGQDCAEADADAQAACVRNDLERKFRCLATLGTEGSGFEMGLEAMRLATDCNGPNAARFGVCCVDGVYNPNCAAPPEAAPDFLRPEALLVVVVVSDEDDCSYPSVNPDVSHLAICRHGIEDRDDDGVPDGFHDPEVCADEAEQCLARECGMLSVVACYEARCEVPMRESDSCEWQRVALTPVEDYAEHLFRLKAHPEDQILFAAIVGERLYTPSGAEVFWNEGDPASRGPDCDPEQTDDVASLTSDACCPDGQCLGGRQPSCTSIAGEAFPGRRYLELAEAIGAVARPCLAPTSSLCEGDLQRPLADLANCVQDSLSAWCLQAPPVCQAVADDGLPRACSPAEAADPANYPMRVYAECDDPEACEALAPRAPVPDGSWTLELGAQGCPGGARVLLHEPPAVGATVTLDYLVSADD